MGVWERLSWWEPCALERALWRWAQGGLEVWVGWGELEQQGPGFTSRSGCIQQLLGWLGLRLRDLSGALQDHPKPLSSRVG